MTNFGIYTLRTENIKAVIFDMDGVLVNTTPCHDSAYKKLWEKLKLDGPVYAEIAGRSTSDVVSDYCNNLSFEEQKQAVAYKQNVALELLQTEDIIFNDTLEVLRNLKNSNFRLALATGASLHGVQLVLKRLNAENFFDYVVTAEDVGRSKPEPEIFIKAVNGVNMQSEQVLIIEDSKSGVQAGLASGAWVVSVRELSGDIKHNKYVGHFDSLLEMYQNIFEEQV